MEKGLILCPKCGVEKPRDEFYGVKKRSGWCKPCSKAKSKAYYHANTGKQREAHRRWVAANPGRTARHKAKAAYRLTDEEYDRLMASPCAICGATSDLVIDHCHASGTTRGRLCHGCNKGLGFFRDDPALLRKAARYLR
jgi:hypothetical protein